MKNINKKSPQKSNEKLTKSTSHPNKKSKSPDKEKHYIKIQKQKTDKFPKNVNEFRHIMDDVNCCVPDIEYMLELRRHKNIPNIEKNISSIGPGFYEDDLQKYKKKLLKQYDQNKLLKTNIGKFRHIFGDRTKYAINNSLYNFEVNLRDPIFYNKSKSVSPKIINNTKNKNWNSTLIPKEKSLFDTLLPPITTKAREIFSKIENKIGRPIIKINKDGYINGEKVKKRVFEFNNNLALRYPSDHFPSSKYSNDYGIQNIGSIKHLLNDDNRTMTSFWCTNLRGFKKKKFMPEEIKQREKRLRNISSDKSYPKS